MHALPDAERVLNVSAQSLRATHCARHEVASVHAKLPGQSLTLVPSLAYSAPLLHALVGSQELPSALPGDHFGAGFVYFDGINREPAGSNPQHFV
jgi:hypothetical protein